MTGKAGDPVQALRLAPEQVEADAEGCVASVRAEVDRRGGAVPPPETERQKRMKVTVKLGSPLSEMIGENKLVLSVEDGASVDDVLEELCGRYPDFDDGLKGKGLQVLRTRPLYSLFVNSRPVSWEEVATTPLRDGDRVYLFLPVVGG